MKTQQQVKAPVGLLQMQTEVTDGTWLSQKCYIKGRVWHQTVWIVVITHETGLYTRPGAPNVKFRKISVRKTI